MRNAGRDLEAYKCHAANSSELSGKVSPLKNPSVATWELFSLSRQGNTIHKGLSFLMRKN
jgi:hypothetical protein